MKHIFNKENLKKWLKFAYLRKRALDGIYAIGLVLIGWMSFKTMVGDSVSIIVKDQMPLEYRICITGDTGTGEDKQKLVASFLKEEKCNELRIMGDIIYPNGIKDENDPQFYEKFYDVYKSLDIPIYVTLGNHDNMRNIGAWIKLSQKHPDVIIPYYYYAEQYGDVCLLSLDTSVYTTLVKADHEKGQNTFIKETVNRFKENSCRLTMSLSHHPYISHGSHGDSHGRVKKMYESYLVGKIDVILAGHDHNLSYEGTVSNTHNIVSGAGGKIRIPYKYLNKNRSDPIKTERGWVNFNYGYYIFTYKGNGQAEFTEKYIKDDSIIQGNTFTITGSGVR